MSARDPEVYADFLLPHLTPHTHLVDVGCGSGELTLGLAPSVGSVTGVDIEPDEIEAARRAAAAGSGNATFLVGSAYSLGLPGAGADAVLAHSVLEALDRPGDAVDEMVRVLRPGGVLAVASVEYGGLVLAGPHSTFTRRFFDIRESLWLSEGADPYLGRHLRGLLLEHGLVDVDASTRAISYGTVDAVREFGAGRAEDSLDPWFVTGAVRDGLATRDELREMAVAWREWAESPASYAAFTWCRALGRRTGP